LISKVLDSLEDKLRQGGFQIASNIPAELPLVRIDPEAAEQALQNIVSNAMKYSLEHRFIAVAIDHDNVYARVRVTDRGIGIPRYLQRKIFLKFYRIQSDKASRSPRLRPWARHRRPDHACTRRIHRSGE
jgi:signal transduction histidine kinase